MSLNNLKKRVTYRGGARQVDRMIEDKERSLSKALLYSYQSATAVLEDGREFRCLINSNKISMEADDKMLSIPFEDVCLNKTSLEDYSKEKIGIKCGSVIEWKETGTHWLVYSQYLQEIAYFRGLMRQCDTQIEIIDANGNKINYWVYLKGPDEKGIDWQKTKHFIFNNLNYTVEIYISNTTETQEFFHRFKKLKIKGKPFEVQAVDDISTNGILTVYLKEDYTNNWEDEPKNIEIKPEVPDGYIYIEGPDEVYPYDLVNFKILNANKGTWSLNNNKARIIDSTDTMINLEIISGKSGEIDLTYTTVSGNNIIKKIKILSF